MGYKVAVVGATGAVGREMLKTLAEREFPADEVVALASGLRGQEVSFGEDPCSRCSALETLRLRGHRDRPVLARRRGLRGACAARRRGGLRGDRQHQPVPHGPGRAAGRARGESRRARRLPQANIIANPNCSTIQLVVALKPLHDVATHQAGGGRDLPVGLGRRQGGHGRAVRPDQGRSTCTTPPAPKQFPKQIAFNVHPADRRLPARRRDQGRMEDGGRDQEDPGPGHRGHRDLRARAGVRRPCRGGATSSSRRDHRRARRARGLRDCAGRAADR